VADPPPAAVVLVPLAGDLLELPHAAASITSVAANATTIVCERRCINFSSPEKRCRSTTSV
jgi:hypothetical protein